MGSPTDQHREVTFLPSTATALDALGIVERVGTVNLDLPAMAWLWFVLRHVEDGPAFPHGKWATLQHLEGQLANAARASAGAPEPKEGDSAVH